MSWATPSMWMEEFSHNSIRAGYSAKAAGVNTSASEKQEMAKAAEAPLLAQIPIDPRLAQLCDQGDIEQYDAEFINSFAEVLIKAAATDTKQKGGDKGH